MELRQHEEMCCCEHLEEGWILVLYPELIGGHTVRLYNTRLNKGWEVVTSSLMSDIAGGRLLPDESYK